MNWKLHELAYMFLWLCYKNGGTIYLLKIQTSSLISVQNLTNTGYQSICKSLKGGNKNHAYVMYTLCLWPCKYRCGCLH